MPSSVFLNLVRDHRSIQLSNPNFVSSPRGAVQFTDTLRRPLAYRFYFAHTPGTGSPTIIMQRVSVRLHSALPPADVCA